MTKLNEAIKYYVHAYIRKYFDIILPYNTETDTRQHNTTIIIIIVMTTTPTTPTKQHNTTQQQHQQ